MTDAVEIALLGNITAIVVVIINGKMTRKKVENYHKEVNGKMGKLLETTEQLGKEKGIAQEKQDNINKTQ